MKHSLTNPNQVQFNVLDFFDNHIRKDEMYIEMDDDLNVPMQFKGTKCILLSCAPTRAELDMCRHFEITSYDEWNSPSVNIHDLRNISQLFKNDMRYIYHTKRDTVYTYPIPTSTHVHNTYLYHDPSSDEDISLEIFSSFIQLKDIFIAQINATMIVTTRK